MATKVRAESAGNCMPRYLWACAFALFVAIGAVVLWPTFQQQRAARILRALLPAKPAHIEPTELSQRINAADTAARTGRGAMVSAGELGLLYQANGYNQAAQKCWDVLQRIQPREARWVYYSADLSRARSDYAEMSALLVQTVQLAPDYAPARLRLADWQLKNGQLDAALENYTQRLKLIPKDPYARLGLARIALQQGRRDQAGSLLADLVRDTPAFSSGHDLYAQYLESSRDSSAATKQRWLGRETGRYRDAEDPWMDELSERCYDYQRLLVLGTLNFQTEHYDQAETFFRRAIHVDPRAFSAYESIGRLYLKKHDANRAREILEEGLRQPAESRSRVSESGLSSQAESRPSVMYYVNLGQAYRELSQPAHAVEVARRGLAELGDNLELEDALGVALAAEGDYDEAIEALRRALQFNPNDSDSNYNLALCLRSEGREDEALDALRRSLILQPTFPAALLIFARREMAAGRFDDAEKFIQPLYESHPEMKEVREIALQWRLGMAKRAEAAKDYDAAEKQYRGAMGIEPDDPDLYSQLAVMLLVGGQPQRALPWLEQYFKMRPKDARGALFLGQAYAMQGRLPEAKQVLASGVAAAEADHNATTAAHLREILQSLP